MRDVLLVTFMAVAAAADAVAAGLGRAGWVWFGNHEPTPAGVGLCDDDSVCVGDRDRHGRRRRLLARTQAAEGRRGHSHSAAVRHLHGRHDILCACARPRLADARTSRQGADRHPARACASPPQGPVTGACLGRGWVIGFYAVKGGIFTIATLGQYRVWGPEDSFIYDNNAFALATVMSIPLWAYLYTQYKLGPWIRVGIMFCRRCFRRFPPLGVTRGAPSWRSLPWPCSSG